MITDRIELHSVLLPLQINGNQRTSTLVGRGDLIIGVYSTCRNNVTKGLCTGRQTKAIIVI